MVTISKNLWMRASWIGILLIPVFALCACLILGPPRLIYDEPYHIDLAILISEEGWINGLTSPDNHSAAGVLYPAIHLALSPLTSFKAPAIRSVNFLLFILCVCILSPWLQSLRPDLSFAPLLILGVPYIWPTLGMALTEFPSLFFYSLHCWMIWKLLQSGLDARSLGIFAILAGISLGIAILGRQTYLVALGPLGALFLVRWQSRWPWLLAGMVAVASSFWLFWIWGGLVAPSQAQVSGPLRFDHGILGAGYLGVGMLVLNPSFLTMSTRTAWVAAIIIGTLMAFMLFRHVTPPAKSLLVSWVGEEASKSVGFWVHIPMCILAFLWLWNTGKRACTSLGDHFCLWVNLSALCLAFVPVKISHLFSSRYMAGALFIILIQALPDLRLSLWLRMRLITGSALGCLTLVSYYR